MKLKISAFVFLILCSIVSVAQMQQFHFKRELSGINNQWHKIILPTDIYKNINNNLSDIRIYGITVNDTIEAPYLLKLKEDKAIDKKVDFNIINRVTSNNALFFTFEVPAAEPINLIHLNFEQDNFEWRISLEGSNDQNEWFTILADYRILSIKNELTDFKFTDLKFPTAKYRYLKIKFQPNQKPNLVSVSLVLKDQVQGEFNAHQSSMKLTEEKTKKQTHLDIELPEIVPVSFLKIFVEDTFDFFRPVVIQYLSDSVSTEKGMLYTYTDLYSGTLNSFSNEFRFTNTITKKLRVIISNLDNMPLRIKEVEVKGTRYEIFTRITETATYYLVYGNASASFPKYDLSHFENKLPEDASVLSIGTEQKIIKADKKSAQPFFKKEWLWAIMILIILLLGGFSFKMIKHKQRDE